MKKPSPTALGVFVILGLALGILCAVLFSSRALFHPHVPIICYFDGSLKGLHPGAPVKFRGVTIGTVDQILIRHNQAENDFAMPVITSIDVKLANSKSDQHLTFRNPKLQDRIKQGLRARLDSESLVTGILYISVDIVSNAPPPIFHQLSPQFDEVPTIPSQTQKLMQNLERVDLAALAANANKLITDVDAKIAQLDVAQINGGLTNLLGSANKVVGSADITNTLVAARRALEDAQKLVKHVDSRVDPLANGLTNTLASAQAALGDARHTLQNASAVIGPDSSLRSDLSDALQQLSTASRAVADLADFVKRNPDSLVMGRKQPKE